MLVEPGATLNRRLRDASRPFSAWHPQQPLAFLLIAVVLSIAAVLALRYWSFGAGPVAPFGAYEEQFIEYNFARNFAEKGFAQLKFLPDASVDGAAAGPPVAYTHFPPLASVIGGVLVRAGVDSLPALRLVMVFVFIAGLAAIAAFFRQQAGAWHALGVVTIVAFTSDVLHWSDHLVYAYWFGLSFLAFWALSANPGRRRIYLGLGAVLAISLISYIQLLATLTTLLMFLLARVRGLTWRRVALVFAVAALGVLLHLLQNAAALGVQPAVHDVLYTISNRVFGTPSRTELADFARQHDIVLWGASSPSSITSSTHFYFEALLRHWAILLIAYTALALLARRGDRRAAQSLRLALAFSVGAVVWYLLFPAHGRLYPLPFVSAIAVAVPVGLMLGTFLEFVASVRPLAWLDRRLRDRFWDAVLAVAAGVVVMALSAHLLREWAGRHGGGIEALDAVPAVIVIPLVLAALLVLLDRAWFLLRRAHRFPRAARVALRATGTHAIVVVAGVAALTFVAVLARDSGRPSSLTPAVDELAVLAPFRGQYVWTNVTPHPVAYYTDAPAIGQLPLTALEQSRPQDGFVSTVSRRSPTWGRVAEPNLFFLSRHGIVSAISDTPTGSYAAFLRYLDSHYAVAASSVFGSVVFDLKHAIPRRAVIVGTPAQSTPAAQRLPLELAAVTASSTQGSAHPSRVARTEPSGFWHRAVEGPRPDPLEIPAWLQVQLPWEASIDVLRVRPRPGFPNQLWRFGTVLSASDDGKQWSDLRTLIMPSPIPDDWIEFAVKVDRPYRFYRLTFWDPSMLSLGKIEAFEPVRAHP